MEFAFGAFLVFSALIGFACWKIFTSCDHDWQVQTRGRTTRNGVPIGQYLIKECSICHKLKTEES